MAQNSIGADSAAGYNIRWLMRAIVRLAAKRLSLALPDLALYARISALCTSTALTRTVRAVRNALTHVLGWRSPPAHLIALAG